MKLARFELIRDVDATGISGTGIVAYGVQFWDGTCVLHWDTAVTSTTIFYNMEALLAIHGHNGKTRVHWLDL